MINYKEEHCWQYDIRLKNRESDIEESGLTQDEIDGLKIKNFLFRAYDLSKDNSMYPAAKAFIQKHEWLGTVSSYPTHLFCATYKGVLCGVVFHDMPTAFSKLLGKDTKKLERLISRGACISYSPKGLASALNMFAIRWMVQHTDFRVFTAYSDVEAKELGTIYQACNFIYLGQTFGAKVQYKSPITGKWVSDRSFRSRSAWKRYAKELGIGWKQEWSTGDKVHWERIPDDVEAVLRKAAKIKMMAQPTRGIKPKHKYAYILGRDKRETKALKKMFTGKLDLPYPKERGV